MLGFETIGFNAMHARSDVLLSRSELMQGKNFLCFFAVAFLSILRAGIRGRDDLHTSTPQLFTLNDSDDCLFQGCEKFILLGERTESTCISELLDFARSQ